MINGKMSEESRLLLEEESRVKNFLFGDKKNKNRKRTEQQASLQNNTRKLNEVPDFLKKRRRIAKEKGRGRDMTATSEDREREAVLDEAVEETEHDLQNFNKPAEFELTEEQIKEDEMYNNMFEPTFIEEPRVVIKS